MINKQFCNYKNKMKVIIQKQMNVKINLKKFNQKKITY